MSAANKAAWIPDVREENEGEFSVQSEKSPGVRYSVDLNSEPPCDCATASYRPNTDCKHVAAVREFKTAQQAAATSPAAAVTKEQEEFFSKMLEGASRIAALVPKAGTLGLDVLARELEWSAQHLAFAVELQRRALPDGQVRTAALAEADHPFRVL